MPRKPMLQPKPPSDPSPPGAERRFEDLRERVRLARSLLETLIRHAEDVRSGTLEAKVAHQVWKELDDVNADLHLLEEDVALREGAPAEPHEKPSRRMY